MLFYYWVPDLSIKYKSIRALNFMYLLLTFAYPWTAWQIPLLMSLISMPGSNSNSYFVFVKVACLGSPGADQKYAGSSSYIFTYLLQRFSNASVSNSVSLCIYRSCSSKFYILKSYQIPSFCVFVISIWDFFHRQIAVKFFFIW